MKRGEIWTASGGPNYVGKPRPVLIIQADAFSATGSITICPLTTFDLGTKYARAPVEPNTDNGLRQPSIAMTDKIATLPCERLGKRLGALKPTAMAPINQAILVFLGLAGSARG